LAKDIKDINHGCNNNLSCATCHIGVSPFTVIRAFMAMANRRCCIAEQYTQTTNIALAEEASADTSANLIPMEYHAGLVNLLHTRSISTRWALVGVAQRFGLDVGPGSSMKVRPKREPRSSPTEAHLFGSPGNNLRISYLSNKQVPGFTE
jgi:hypothetical protein